MRLVFMYVNKEFEEDMDYILRKLGFFVSWYKNVKIPQYEIARKEKRNMAIKYYPTDFKECDERFKDYVLYALWVW